MPRLVRPTTNARRKMSFADFGTLTKKRPEKSLTRPIKKNAGRDRFGRISIRHRGGGAKRLYRLIDFKFLPFTGEAVVEALEYDPNRSAFIALIRLPDDTKSYILAADGLKVGDKVTSGAKSLKVASRMTLAEIAPGSQIHNIELQPGRGGQLARGAGAWATLSAIEGDYAYIKLPSSEVRKVLVECMASLGSVSNSSYNLVRYSKAGRSRLVGRRPSVRGKAMYPAAHPHGGGEGVNPIGLKRPKTPWGKAALGVKTRRNKRTDKYIISRRKKK